MTAGTPQGPIALSGWGLVHATGGGRIAADRAFGQAELVLREIDRAGGYHRASGSRLGALVDPDCLAPWLAPRVARRMSAPSRYAVAAARIALEHAGLAAEGPSSMAVITSTCFGPSSYTEELLRQIYFDSPQAASPFLFTEAVANAPAAQIALQFQATGPSVTVTQREAGSSLALARGAGEVARGRAERALIAACDELNPLLHAALDRFGVFAGSRGGPEVGRPFDAGRHGYVAGEGAVAILVEPAAAALARGATPFALLRAHVAAFDPAAPVAAWGPDPAILGDALADGLARQGVELGSIDAVIANAGGSRAGDAAEGGVLRHVFGVALPMVFAPNAYSGQHAAIPLAFACWLLDGGQPAPTPHFERVDPKLGIRPWTGGELPPLRRLLISTPAVGGAASFLVLDAWMPNAAGATP